MSKTLLIDGDILIYWFAVRHEKSTDWSEGEDDGVVTRHADLDAAKVDFAAEVERLQEKLKADASVVCLSDARNFRKELVHPSYKANRKNTLTPLALKPLKAWVQEHYKCYLRPTLEADDILGILATSETIIPGKKCIVSTDNDMAQIPGFWFNPNAPEKGAVKISERDADFRFYMQALTGDRVDGYPGCPGVGPKKAEAILFGISPPWGHVSEVWPAILKAYADKGLDADFALQQARLARILRSTDYDFKTKAPILWSPTAAD